MNSATFPVVEATIDGIHAAFRDSRLTCRALVEAYLRPDCGARPGWGAPQQRHHREPGGA